MEETKRYAQLASWVTNLSWTSEESSLSGDHPSTSFSKSGHRGVRSNRCISPWERHSLVRTLSHQNPYNQFLTHLFSHSIIIGWKREGKLLRYYLISRVRINATATTDTNNHLTRVAISPRFRIFQCGLCGYYGRGSNATKVLPGNSPPLPPTTCIHRHWPSASIPLFYRSDWVSWPENIRKYFLTYMLCYLPKKRIGITDQYPLDI